MKTTSLLIEDLNKVKSTPLIIDIILNASKGYYHDFDSPLPFPKHILEMDLREAGLDDIADDVIEGKYD